MDNAHIVSGPQSSVNALQANQMPENDRLLYLIYPTRRPLFQKMYFSSGHKSEVVYNDKGLFNWFEDELYPIFTSLTGAGIVGGSTTENIETKLSVNFLQPNDVLIVESTGQMVYVTTITTHTTIAALTSGEVITACASGNVRKVSSLNHEAAGPRTAVSTIPVQVSNYLTIHNESVSFTNRQIAGKTYTNGTSFKEQIEKKIDEMKLMYENNFKFSTQSGIIAVTGSDGNSYNATYGKGLQGMITSHIFDYTTITEDLMDASFATLFDSDGSDVKDFYFGTNLSIAVEKLVKQKYGYLPTEITTEYGVNLSRWKLKQGTVNMIWDPTMSGQYKDWGFVVDTNARSPLKMMYMNDDDLGSRKFRIEKRVQTNGTDIRLDKLIADIGIKLPNESIHGIFRKIGA